MDTYNLKWFIDNNNLKGNYRRTYVRVQII